MHACSMGKLVLFFERKSVAANARNVSFIGEDLDSRKRILVSWWVGNVNYKI